MNPYAAQLGNRSATGVIAETPAQLELAVQSLGTDQLDRPIAPGKWTPREIVCHLADCEIAFAFRLRQAIADDRHIIQPFDQARWAAQYSGYETKAALAVFSALRRWNLAFLTTVPPESLDKTVNHPERGDMPFRTIVETMAGHDLNHLAQIKAIR